MHGAQRRGGIRFLCSELVKLEWTSKFGRQRNAVANLEEIEECGAVLQCEGPVRPTTEVRIKTSKVDFIGIVRSCTADFIGTTSAMRIGFRFSIVAPRAMIRPQLSSSCGVYSSKYRWIR